MLLRLKALLQQTTSVSLTTDVAKMPTGDFYVAVTCHWISTNWCLMSAVLGVALAICLEIVSLLNELGVKYTLDGICEQHVRCACHTTAIVYQELH